MDQNETNDSLFTLPKVAIRLVESKEPLSYHEPINTPEKVVAAMQELLRFYDREVVAVVNLRTDLTPINMHIASVGSLNHSLVHPREILKSAILSNAAGIMLVHNHPSGRVEPSVSDTQITDQMLGACKLMGIDFIDHIIVGGDTKLYFSFKEHKALEPTEQRFESDYRKLSFEPEAGKYVQVGDPYVLEKKEAYVTKSNSDQVKDITDQLEAGLVAYMNSEAFTTYLSTMSKFHSYSLNNTILIAMQKPDATLVAGFKAWQNRFGRHVKAGEKGIKILAPAPYKKRIERDKKDKLTGSVITDEKGNPVKETVEITVPVYKPVTVFDVSQTEGKELPELDVKELSFSVEGYAVYLEALKQISPVPIDFEEIEGGAKGFFSPSEQRIVVKKDMPEAQTIKTLIHEICHSLLDDEKHMRIEGVEPKRRSREDKEVTAEATAFTVAKAFGMDVSEYSFGYIGSWSSGKDLKELKESMELIHKASDKLITELTERLSEIHLSREKVTLTVAQVAVQHDAGFCKEYITSVAEAAKTYEATEPLNDTFTKSIAIRVGKKESDWSYEVDLLVGNTFDMGVLTLVPEIEDNHTAMKMIAELIHTFPDANIKGAIPEKVQEHLVKLAAQSTEKKQQAPVQKAPVAEAKKEIVADEKKRPSLRAKLREKMELVAAKPETAKRERGGDVAK